MTVHDLKNTPLDPAAEDHVAMQLAQGLRGANHEIEVCQGDIETLREELQVREARLRRAVEARAQFADAILAHDTAKAEEATGDE